jgi:hypothetical protein
MTRLPEARAGQLLQIKNRDIAFSFFPVTYRNRGWTLSDTVFAVSPWAVMQGVVDSRLHADERAEATAFLRQARDFYVTASERLAANPLLFYYAFLNLGKATLRVRGLPGSLDRAHHGLIEGNGGDSLDQASVKVRDGTKRVHVFPELFRRIEAADLQQNSVLPVADLLAAVVVGHRQWRDAADEPEQFLPLTNVEVMYDRNHKKLWTRLYLDKQDLDRFDVTTASLMRAAGLRAAFRQVVSPSVKHLCLETKDVIEYPTDPADRLKEVVALVRPVLWRIASALPGGAYRRYYVHLTPDGRVRIPQLAALWALWFYFGSVVRYRPHIFDEMLAGPYGAYITEFVAAQPEQLLYLLASELCQREVAKPAIA